jgi:signal transduction histidine kinase
VWCQSEAGQGSAFSFPLPFEQPVEESVAGTVPVA